MLTRKHGRSLVGSLGWKHPSFLDHFRCAPHRPVAFHTAQESSELAIVGKTPGAGLWDPRPSRQKLSGTGCLCNLRIALAAIRLNRTD